MSAKGILGGLAGLFVGATIIYACNHTRDFKGIVDDSRDSAVRTVDRVHLDSPLERATRAAHDVGQRNPDRALNEYFQWDPSFENTPYQSRKRAGMHTKHTYEILEGMEELYDKLTE